jgi:hypothetical protein
MGEVCRAARLIYARGVPVKHHHRTHGLPRNGFNFGVTDTRAAVADNENRRRPPTQDGRPLRRRRRRWKIERLFAWLL